MANFAVFVNSKQPLSLGSKKRKDALRRVVNRLTGLLSGANRDEDFTIINDETVANTSHRAAGLWFSGSTGTVSALINGTQVDVTYATSTTVTAGLMVTAINADATAKTFVSASQYVGKITLASVLAGTTISFGGYTLTATSAATGKPGEFDISGDDTADALAFCNAFNSLPGLCEKAHAVNTAGVVYIALFDNRAAYSNETIVASAATVTVDNQIVAGGLLSVVAHSPGKIGNACTWTASGTGASVLSLVSGKLGGGSGGILSSDIINSGTK